MWGDCLEGGMLSADQGAFAIAPGTSWTDMGGTHRRETWDRV